MPAVEKRVAVFGVSVGFFFFVSQVWPGSCEFGRLSVVLLSVRIFALGFFALPIVRLIKIAKVTNLFTTVLGIQFQLLGCSAPIFVGGARSQSNGFFYSRLSVSLFCCVGELCRIF